MRRCRLTLLIFLAFPLFGCAPAKPSADCGSADTLAVVQKIAKEHPGRLADSVARSVVFSSGKIVPNPNGDLSTSENMEHQCKMGDKASCDWVITGEPIYCGTVAAPRLAGDKTMCARHHPWVEGWKPYDVPAAIQDVIDSTNESSYSLSSIRMTSRDQETKNVSCSAKLHFEIGEKAAELDTSFKVENTTDGGIYVTFDREL
jgi:hypothetical protein